MSGSVSAGYSLHDHCRAEVLTQTYSLQGWGCLQTVQSLQQMQLSRRDTSLVERRHLKV